MRTAGQITKTPQFRMRILLSLQIAWLGLVCLLGFWWGHVLLKQAQLIAELERKTGMADSLIALGWHKTQRMLFWESGAFFLFLLGSMALMVGLYWRDFRRARSIQAFFASVTHELKTPLTSIRLQAESIADSLPENHEARPLTGRLMEDTSRLETQVERVLELARLEGGGPVFARAVNLRQLVDRFLKGWTPSYRAKIEIINKVEDAEVLADPTALQVILRNLLDNSIRHSQKEKTRVVLTSGRKNGTIELTLTDNGSGAGAEIPTQIRLGRLFEKGSASQGTGVGLYLVTTLMERMGGRASFVALGATPDSESGFQASLFFMESPEEGQTHG